MTLTMGKIKEVANSIKLDMNLVSFIIWIAIAYSRLNASVMAEDDSLTFENIQKYFNE